MSVYDFPDPQEERDEPAGIGPSEGENVVRGATPLTQRALIPAPVPPALERAQDQGFRGMLQHLRRLFFGHTINDIDRLREAAVLRQEEKTRAVKVQSDLVEAQASKIFAETEQIKQRTAIEAMHAAFELEAKKTEMAERQASAARIEVEAARQLAAARLLQEAQQAAEDRLTAAITKIQIMGGDVFFSSDQIDSTLRQLGPAPDDEPPADEPPPIPPPVDPAPGSGEPLPPVA
jgi:hypothetical protein